MLSAAVRRSGPARSCGAHPFWTWERRRSRTSTRTCSSSSNRSRRRCDRAQLGGRADIAAGCRDHSKSVAWWLRSQRLLRLRPSAASSPCQVRRSVGSSALNRGRGLRRAWACARANPPLRRPDTVAEPCALRLRSWKCRQELLIFGRSDRNPRRRLHARHALACMPRMPSRTKYTQSQHQERTRPARACRSALAALLRCRHRSRRASLRSREAWCTRRSGMQRIRWALLRVTKPKSSRRRSRTRLRAAR